MICTNLGCFGHLEPVMNTADHRSNPCVHRCHKCGDFFEVEVTVKKIETSMYDALQAFRYGDLMHNPNNPDQLITKEAYHKMEY
jgi:transcription elongation factor Elf1